MLQRLFLYNGWVSKGPVNMSGYILYLLFGLLVVMFWRARAGQTLDQLLETDHQLHRQALAVNKIHPKGGRWADHRRWMAEQE